LTAAHPKTGGYSPSEFADYIVLLAITAPG
jgi:hypothetical protein